MKLLTTGAFAKLCETKKGTLFFYDNEGLLKPKYVSENGYRRYGAEQFFDFDLIAMLKEAGSTLKEIKNYLDSNEPEEIVTFLEERKQRIKKEQSKLAARYRMLEELIAINKAVKEATFDTLEFVEQKEEKLELFKTGYGPQLTVADHEAQLREYMEHIKKQGDTPYQTLGMYFNIRDESSGQHTHYFPFHAATRKTDTINLHIKPEGTYGVCMHRGTISSHNDALEHMLVEIKEAGFTIQGDVYVYDMASYITGDRSLEEYLRKYCFRVV